MASLPKLYTLDMIPVAGHIERAVPPSLNCFECGSLVGSHYLEFEFVFDALRECDLVMSSDSDVYLASRQLLRELDTISSKGYEYRAVQTSASDNLRACESMIAVLSDFQHLAITGRCDGPWVHHTKGETCPECGQIPAESRDFEAWMSEAAGDIPRQPRLVYPETWHGEDFFLLSEPGPPVITERVATILAKTGNLRRKEVIDRNRIRKLMPSHAARLEKQAWQAEVCSRLGPADWATSLDLGDYVVGG
jgi:hypothetical protein